MNDCHLSRKGNNFTRFFVDVQVITGNSEKIRGWDLLTHGLFLTHTHHDAHGFTTYMTVRSETKIWMYVDTMKSALSSRKLLFTEWDGMFMRTINMNVPNVPLGTMVLWVGDTMYVIFSFVLVFD